MKSLIHSILICIIVISPGVAIGRDLSAGLPKNELNDTLNGDHAPKSKSFVIITPISPTNPSGFSSFGTTYPNGTTVITDPNGNSTFIYPQGRK